MTSSTTPQWRQAISDFTNFLNEPPQYEDQRMVRDYRHEAYRQWEGVLAVLLPLLDGKHQSAAPVTPICDAPEYQLAQRVLKAWEACPVDDNGFGETVALARAYLAMVEWHQSAARPSAAAPRRCRKCGGCETSGLPASCDCSSPEWAPSAGVATTHPNGLWMVYYEDAEVSPEVFFGEGAESAARARYATAKDNWSCHLLSRVPSFATSASAPSAGGAIDYPALIEKMLFIGELAHAEGWNDHPQVEDNGTRACRYIDEVRMALRSAQESAPSAERRTVVCVSDEQLLKTYDDARYAAACPVSGIGTDGHTEGLRAIADAAGFAPSAIGAWIPCSERLPPYGERVLVAGWVYQKPGTERWYSVAYRTENAHDYGDWLRNETDDCLYSPTHWMRIDAPADSGSKS